MKIVLIKSVERLGKSGDIVTVKEGFARNYLLPQGLALPATSGGVARFEHEKKTEVQREVRRVREAEELSSRLALVSLTAAVQAGEDDRLFGSVTAQDIAELLAKEGHDIDKRKILIEEPIKALGVYTVPVKLHKDVTAEVKVWVVRQ
jgi:large subunit ribosomal protein L9